MSLVKAFVLRSILSDMGIATPAFLLLPFAWNIFIPSHHCCSGCGFYHEVSHLLAAYCRYLVFFLNPISHSVFWSKHLFCCYVKRLLIGMYLGAILFHDCQWLCSFLCSSFFCCDSMIFFCNMLESLSFGFYDSIVCFLFGLS